MPCSWTLAVGRGMFTWTEWVLRTRKRGKIGRWERRKCFKSSTFLSLPLHDPVNIGCPPPTSPTWLHCDFPTTFIHTNSGACFSHRTTVITVMEHFSCALPFFHLSFAGDQVVAINNSIAAAALSKAKEQQQQRTACLIEPTDQVRNTKSCILLPFSSSKDRGGVEGMNESNFITN